MKKQLPDITHKTIVYTKHARERLELRRLNEDMVIQVMRNPNKTHEIDDGKMKFIGKSMGAKVHAVCKPLPEENKWLVITLWARGEEDPGHFINRRKSQGNEQFNFTTLYVVLVFLIIILAIIVVYFAQQG